MSHLKSFVQSGKKIIGVAANYHSLLKVLGKPVPDNPEIFLKPTTSYVTGNDVIVIPDGFSVNEEVELGVIIGRKGKNIPERDVWEYVGGYCVALDMTATCRMKVARSTGGSWTLGKGFDTATPVSSFISTSSIVNPENVNLWCSVNGNERQNGHSSDMVFSISKLISFISKYMTLEPCDLILTGSPPGMGSVADGDVVECGIKGVAEMKFIVLAEKPSTVLC